MNINDEWHDISGTWLKEDGKLTQTSLESATRTYIELGMTDFILETTFIMNEVAPEQLGEAKIIFSDADENENYRIDFMGLNFCRITMGGISIGSPLNMLKKKEYRVKVTVRKNLISVNVDDMLILPNIQFGKTSNGKVGIGTYYASVTFTEPKFTKFVSRKCFILMPFDEKRNFLYDYVIAPTLLNHPKITLEYNRADKLLTAGKITEEINEKIDEADILIADISEDNRNVYFELGISHAKKRKVILLKEKIEGKPIDLPFDIKDWRTHVYEFSPAGFTNIRERLTEIISNELSSSDDDNNVR